MAADQVFGIKALLVSWLTLWWIHTRLCTHTHTLAGFTTPCILLGLVLAGKLKDSLKDHLTDEAQSTHIHTQALFLVLFCIQPSWYGKVSSQTEVLHCLRQWVEGSYASIHLPNSTATLPSCQITADCRSWPGWEQRECSETTSDAWAYLKTNIWKTLLQWDKIMEIEFKAKRASDQNMVLLKLRWELQFSQSLLVSLLVVEWP